MELEYNGTFKGLLEVQEMYQSSIFANGMFMKTPPVGEENYWLFRVKLSETQAIVAFPKFCTFGIGFEKENKSWNTNLPFTCDTEEIYNHIKLNKCDKNITKANCIKAIRMIQEGCKNINPDSYS